MESDKQNVELIAYCGLYCGACSKYLKGKCGGCEKNENAKWCKIRSCNIENKYKSCADCCKEGSVKCKKYNNFIGKAIGFIFNSDRNKNIEFIKVEGYQKLAQIMEESKKMSFTRK